ncbi:hypothetical protein KUV51_17940 [Tateyamaria omphalii]|uniref:hypothetical protein n=1 Tax=Tateyamaria omphalii TaxID=299262 RepID=UPI001C992CB4|nr:hypothetical protein [Tateyamaria omphalii]MBY5934889.1 hypothetical protein [Tateyamaria omphalii]
MTVSTYTSISSLASASGFADGDVAMVSLLNSETGVISYVHRSASTKVPGLPGWDPISPVYLEHYGISTSATKAAPTADQTAALQAAINGTEGDLLFTGFVLVKDKISLSNKCRLHCPSGRTNGGLTVKAGFNMSATSVLEGVDIENGVSIGDLTVWFAQPSTTDRSSLRQYPPCVDLNDGTRNKIDNLRIEGAWVGIKGNSNVGGTRFGHLELGCFDTNIEVDGALDFVHCESIAIWPYGSAGSARESIFYDGVTVGLKLGRVDNWNCDKLSCFRVKSIIDNPASDSRLPAQFGSIALDGNDALLILGGGSSQIANIYSTKNTVAPGTERDITANTGIHTIGLFQAQSGADGIVLATGDAILSITDYQVNQLNGQRRAAIAQQNAQLTIGRARPESNVPRTAAMFEQQVGATMRIGELMPRSATPPAVPYVKFNSDEVLNYVETEVFEVDANTGWDQGYYTDASQNMSKGRLRLLPFNSEGSEVAWTDQNGNISFIFDVFRDGGADVLRIRRPSGGSYLELLENGNLKMPLAPVFADNAAAASLETNTIYKTPTGELRIKF